MNSTSASSAIIPFVAAWDSETPGPESDLTVEFVPEPRLAYKLLPRPRDRDGAGVLWARVTNCPGLGKPIYDSMHPVRQHFCMYTMKCQVCGAPASRNEGGWLFFDWRKPWDPPTWPEGSRTAQPLFATSTQPRPLSNALTVPTSSP